MLDHHNNENQHTVAAKSLQSFDFFKAVLHPNVRKFQAKNHRLSLSHWQCLFQTSLTNVTILNLAMSCSDAILRLIPQYCPLLECLNATCKYERMEYFGNAMSFTLAVTDTGLGYLAPCGRLKVLTVNEARSQGRGAKRSITHEGLRQLLRDVATLEDITYSDSGAVICRQMSDVVTLNLRSIRHFNATPKSLREILRLCPRLDELFLIFFDPVERTEIVDELLLGSRRLSLKVLETHNLMFGGGTSFDRMFQHLGATLVSLSLTNNFEQISFNNLITIAKNCPNLTYLACVRVCGGRGRGCCIDYGMGSGEGGRRLPLNQFQRLENLYLSGHDMDVDVVLRFCTENARNLVSLKVGNRVQNPRTINVDHIFGGSAGIVRATRMPHLRYLDVLPVFEFSKAAVCRVIDEFNQLQCFSVLCSDDLSDVIAETKEQNYDLNIINKREGFAL